ncbi:MAG: crossover junction endodeoxyribonuclease RuvC [Chloroflexota bacterium]|nr:crossover junction endodeoxyribonuclease RuvC [Chloroflexota bacterium]
MSEAAYRVIGIDPGLAATGYGIVSGDGRNAEAVTYGVIRTRSAQPRAQRLQAIHEQLAALITAHGPDELAIEEPYVAANVRSAFAIGEARAAAMIAAAQHGIDVFQYQSTAVKAAVAGYGGAPKEQVQSMVAMQLGLDAPPEPLDAADALALALTRLAEAALESRMAGRP